MERSIFKSMAYVALSSKSSTEKADQGIIESRLDISTKGILLDKMSLFLSAKTFCYANCRNSRALIGLFLLSISGQTHEFIIYAMHQRTRADNLTISYRKKQIDVSFSCVCPVIDNEFRHNIVKVVCGSTRLSPRGSTATLTM